MLKVHLVYCFFSMKKKNLKPLRNLAFRDVEAKTVRKFVTSTSVISNDEDVVRTFGALVVLKIIFFDILISFLDSMTDILQGLHLIYWFDEDGNWSLQTSSNYGVLVLVICWVPGLVCVVHILSHYRYYLGTFKHIKFFNMYL